MRLYWPAWLTSLFMCVGGWTFAAFVMTAAQVFDARARGVETSIFLELPSILPFFAPLMALSWGLDRAYAANPTLVSKPSRIAALYLAFAVGFYPLYILYQGAFGLFLSSRPLSELWSSIGAERRISWWRDFMILSGAFALHTAIAAWRNAVDRERALAEAHAENLQLRLSQLQGQLEPHFLFNALSGISALVRTGEKKEALTALSTMSDLLRHALRASKSDWLSVKDEIDFIEAYLDIQTLRFGDKVKVVKRIGEEDWKRFACPPMLFQPLVENAVRHGLEARPEGASIVIDLLLHGQVIHFEVVNDLGESEGGHGVGHNATRQRLSALYGERATLETRKDGGEYRATLRFPAVCDR